MNKDREAKLGMYDNVIEGCDQDPLIPPLVPAFSTAYGTFKTKVAQIHNTAIILDQNIRGAAIDKGDAKENAAHAFADAADSITAYAASVNNNTLKESVHYSFRSLMRLADEEFQSACGTILQAATDNAAALIPFGIIAATITALQDDLDDWNSAKPGPTNKKSNRKTADIAIDTQFDEADELLKEQLDNAIAPFRTSHPDFYNRYFENRKIINNPTSHTKARGLITDNNGNPLFNVAVTVFGQTYTTTSLLNGTYSLKIPVPAIYTIIFTLPGYQTLQVTNIEIKLGQATTLNVTLIPV